MDFFSRESVGSYEPSMDQKEIKGEPISPAISEILSYKHIARKISRYFYLGLVYQKNNGGGMFCLEIFSERLTILMCLD